MKCALLQGPTGGRGERGSEREGAERQSDRQIIMGPSLGVVEGLPEAGAPHQSWGRRRSCWAGGKARGPSTQRLSRRPAPPSSLTCGNPAGAGWTPGCPLPASSGSGTA